MIRNTIRSAIRKHVRSSINSGVGASGPCKTNLLAQYTGQIVDVGGVGYLVSKVGETDGPVQPGRGYSLDSTIHIAITGLLETDVISVDTGSYTPTFFNEGLNIAANETAWGVTITRSDVAIGYYPCAEGSGTIAFNTLIGQDGALPHGTISDDGVHVELADGTGFDLNLAGFTVADGGTMYADAYMQDLIAEGVFVPPVYGGSESLAWRFEL